MDLSSLISGTVNAKKSLENYINVLTNGYIVKPTSNSGIGGFLFSVRDREAISLSARVTDHYVEANYTLQDHIALAPERVVLRGYVGEINQILAVASSSILTKIQSLASISSFMNDFSAQATQVYNKVQEAVSEVSNVINQAQNIYDIFNDNQTSDTEQGKAFAYFYSLWAGRVLSTIETPFNQFKNMAIESLEATQEGDTKFISDFTVTFKQIRIATTTTKTVTKQTSSKYSVSSALSSATSLNSAGLSVESVAKDRVAAMTSEVSSGGATSGSSYNINGIEATTDLLAN